MNQSNYTLSSISPLVLNLKLNSGITSVNENVVKDLQNAKIIILNGKHQLDNKTIDGNIVTFSGLNAIDGKEHILILNTVDNKLTYTVRNNVLSQNGIYVGQDEPESTDVLWVDDDANSLTSRENDELIAIREGLSDVNEKLDTVYRLYSYGVVPGDSQTSMKNNITFSSEIEAPVGFEDSTDVIQLYEYDANKLIVVVSYLYKMTETDEEPNSEDSDWSNDLPSLSETSKFLWCKFLISYSNGDEENKGISLLTTYNSSKDLTSTRLLYATTETDTSIPDKTSFKLLTQDIGSVVDETNKFLWCFLECVYDYIKPDTSDVSSGTVFHNCCKIDTAANFSENRTHLYNGDMLFYSDQKKFAIYYDGGFYTASGGGSGSGSAGITKEDLYSLPLDYLIFSNGEKHYKLKFTDNHSYTIVEYNEEDNKDVDKSGGNGVYVNKLFTLNSFFATNNGKDKDSLCSHHFVELANASDKPINLKDIYLLYTNGEKVNGSTTNYKWKKLALDGVIKERSTFLIRGHKCRDLETSFIKVDSFDMEWYDEGELITFGESGSFYLVAGKQINDVLEKGLANPYDSGTSNSSPTGYIDLCGYSFDKDSISLPSEGKSILNMTNDNISSHTTLCIRWFMMEPAKQGVKKFAERKTSNLWTYINLNKQPILKNEIASLGEENKYMDNNVYYFKDELKVRFTPMPSMKHKNFFTVKSRFNENQPNMIFSCLGINGTETTNGSGATRCFNWVSVGFFDEYIEYRKVDESNGVITYEDWKVKYSFVSTDFSSSNNESLFYNRIRWCTADGLWVTTHKCIIRNLSKGKYEYRIRRDDNVNYMSDILVFNVKHDDEVKNFNFIHTSDQQGFNFQEYSVWERCASYIAKEDDVEFIINTGDATQSGNRPSEWIDYYNGRKKLRHLTEMYSIGNNDLCGYYDTKLTNGEDKTSKYNHLNVRRYFTFEIDTENMPLFSWTSNTNKQYNDCILDSVYSFNYGDYHFISLNSEIAVSSSKMYENYDNDEADGDNLMAKTAYEKMEEWLINDLENYKKRNSVSSCSKCIVYCHEMPFTIVTEDFMTSDVERSGSKLNTLNKNGLYRFSRLFYKYGIRLVLGGHKHTFSISKPIYDAPIEWNSGWTPNQKEFIEYEVSKEASRKPVIQIKNENQIKTEYNNWCRYQVVNKFTAPTYVMAQATGYKLVSNKELPAQSRIPWLLSYYPCSIVNNTKTVNALQYHPMYIKYDVNESEIAITVKQITNIFNNKKYDFNEQLTIQEINEMVLSVDVTLEDDFNIYTEENYSKKNKYIIKL